MTVTCQASTSGWYSNELESFLNKFLVEHLLELRQYLIYGRCGMEEKGMPHISLPTVCNHGAPIAIEEDKVTAKSKPPTAVSSEAICQDQLGVNVRDGSGHPYGPGIPPLGRDDPRGSKNVSPVPIRTSRPLGPLGALGSLSIITPPRHIGTDSTPTSPAHSPGFAGYTGLAGSTVFTETDTPPIETPPIHRGGARSLMRRLAPTRDNSKNGITTTQPGAVEDDHVRKARRSISPAQIPIYPLPANTWRNTPENVPFDTEHTDHITKGSVTSSSTTITTTTDSSSVATKRKLSLRKSLISLSPFHAPTSSTSTSSTPSSSSFASSSSGAHGSQNVNSSVSTHIGTGIITSPALSATVPPHHTTTHTTTHTTHNNTTSHTGYSISTPTSLSPKSCRSHSEPTSPWGMGHPSATQNTSPHDQINTNTNTSTNGNGHGNGHNSGSTNSAISAPISSSVKRRSKNTNSEASILRGHIAAKEYEVQRITKDLERRREKERKQDMLAHPSSGFISRVSDSKPKTNETAAQLYSQSQELAKVRRII